jgi:SAM-dependent methyltransferase
LTLGVPTLNFSDGEFWREVSGREQGQALQSRSGTPFRDHAAFFRMLGYETVDALDISDYEGANIVGDLNDPALPERFTRRYDLIYDSGTIEHVFDITVALRSIDQLVKPGGSVVHATPSNGFLDHGFWQVSPDLFRFFYRAPAYACLTSALYILDRWPYSLPADENLYRHRGRSYIVDNAPVAIAVFAAEKLAERKVFSGGLQNYYDEMHGAGGPAGNSMAFYVAHGSRCHAWVTAWRPLRALSGGVNLIERAVRKLRRLARGMA